MDNKKRKLTFKGKEFIYDEENRLICFSKSPEKQVKLEGFYDKEEDMPEELLALIEETIEEMCSKEYLAPKEGSAEEEDTKE